MKIMIKLSIIFLISIIGNLISNILPFSFSGSLISLILLSILLIFRVIKEDSIKDISDFLLNNMAFFFLPSAVAILEYFQIIKPILLEILIICFITTILTYLAAYYSSAITRKILSGGSDNE